MNKIARPRFPRRVLVAGLTSLLALPLFFVPIPLFLVAAPWLMEISEPLASVAMYSSCIGLSGAVSLAINRHWLRGTWLATATTMIGPYLVLAAPPLALGLVYLRLARNPDRFILGLCSLPLFGVIGPVIFAGVVSLIGGLAHRLRSAPVSGAG
jgi:hypothetical protein